MIVALEIPPGSFKNGTEYQAKGRWRDVNLVRWRDGAMRPVGGFTIQGTKGVYSDTGLGRSDPASFGIGRPGAIAWVDNSGNKWVLFAMTIGAVVYSVANGRTYGLSSGLGQGEWTWDTFGQIPIGCNSTAGVIVEWDLNVANNLTQVTNSPTSCTAVVVTDERFIFALGAGGDPRRVEWCDRDDRTVWTPASTNQAGGWNLDTEGEIKFGMQMRGETIIVTTADAWRARYVGAPNVWEFQRIGPCTCAGANVGTRVGDAAYWMGDGEFYVYRGGYVDRLPCEVSDYVFSNAVADSTIFFAWHNIEFGEVWFHYSVADTVRADSVAVYAYRDNHWGLHTGLKFSAVAGRGVLDKPLAMNNNRSGVDYDFSVDPGGFTLGTNWRIAGGVLDQSAPTASVANFVHPTTANQGYLLKVTIANRANGTLTIAAGSESLAVSTNGEVFIPFTAPTANTTISFTADGTWDGDVADLTIDWQWIYAIEDAARLYYDTTAPYAETGPLEIGDGERRAHVTRLIPDEQDQGELKYTFQHREYPTGSEVTETTVNAANPTDVRFSGRQFTMKVERVSDGADFRVGVHRLEVRQGGKR